jgi:hypothetical protein
MQIKDSIHHIYDINFRKIINDPSLKQAPFHDIGTFHAALKNINV